MPMTLKSIELDFEDVLEYTFMRGESLGDKLKKVAFDKLQDLHPEVDYQNMTVGVHEIFCEDCATIEVVFRIEGEPNK